MPLYIVLQVDSNASFSSVSNRAVQAKTVTAANVIKAVGMQEKPEAGEVAELIICSSWARVITTPM